MSHQKSKRQRTHPSPRPRILLQPIVEAHSRDLTPDECVALGKQLVHCGRQLLLKGAILKPELDNIAKKALPKAILRECRRNRLKLN